MITFLLLLFPQDFLGKNFLIQDLNVISSSNISLSFHNMLVYLHLVHSYTTKQTFVRLAFPRGTRSRLYWYENVNTHFVHSFSFSPVICPFDPFGESTNTRELYRSTDSQEFPLIVYRVGPEPRFLPHVDQKDLRVRKKFLSAVSERRGEARRKNYSTRRCLCWTLCMRQLSNARIDFFSLSAWKSWAFKSQIHHVDYYHFISPAPPPPRPGAEVKSHMKK